MRQPFSLNDALILSLDYAELPRDRNAPMVMGSGSNRGIPRYSGVLRIPENVAVCVALTKPPIVYTATQICKLCGFARLSDHVNVWSFRSLNCWTSFRTS